MIIMKRLFIIMAALFLPLSISLAQKFAFVDTEYILNNIPAYKAAQEQLDKFSADWQKEVEAFVSHIPIQNNVSADVNTINSTVISVA